MNDRDKIEAAILQAQTEPCILCGGKAAMAGLFVPDNSQEFGAPANKQRMIAYALCKKCKGKYKVRDQVESLLKSRLTVH